MDLRHVRSGDFRVATAGDFVMATDTWSKCPAHEREPNKCTPQHRACSHDRRLYARMSWTSDGQLMDRPGLADSAGRELPLVSGPFLWSGRRDSNPRPHLGKKKGRGRLSDLRRCLHLTRELRVFIRMQRGRFVSLRGRSRDTDGTPATTLVDLDPPVGPDHRPTSGNGWSPHGARTGPPPRSCPDPRKECDDQLRAEPSLSMSSLGVRT